MGLEWIHDALGLSGQNSHAAMAQGDGDIGRERRQSVGAGSFFDAGINFAREE